MLHIELSAFQITILQWLEIAMVRKVLQLWLVRFNEGGGVNPSGLEVTQIIKNKSGYYM